MTDSEAGITQEPQTPESHQPYDNSFYEWQERGSKSSAREIIPLVQSLAHAQSVLDVGCGTGAWLSTFREFGVEDIQGVDGGYVTSSGRLMIPQENFQAQDLESPLNLERTYDLVVSLEVAEHISPENANQFIDNLVRHGDKVLFSAAIPHQGGSHHVNEQWQSYWAELFKAKGYVAIDAIRKATWNNSNVEWWYSQNTILYARMDQVADDPNLRREFGNTNPNQLDLVHPGNYEDAVKVIPPEEYHQKRYGG